MTIHLGRPLPDASRDQPGRRRGNALGPQSPYCPYSVLLPVGFTMPSPLPGMRCALTAPFHPYRPGLRPGRRSAFCGTFPRVAPAGCYPAPCFRGARTFLPPNRSGGRPSGRLAGQNLSGARVQCNKIATERIIIAHFSLRRSAGR